MVSRIVIGWQDARESRRAVADALLLLQQAAWVGVVEIAGDEELPAARLRLANVAAGLGRHARRCC